MVFVHRGNRQNKETSCVALRFELLRELKPFGFQIGDLCLHGVNLGLLGKERLVVGCIGLRKLCAKPIGLVAQLVELSRKLLLPVPANGRGIDMFVYLSRFGLPLFAEENIVKNTKELSEKKNWIKPFDFPCENYTTVSNSNRDELLHRMSTGVYLFGDGMMTTAASLKYFESVKDDSNSRIIISGHSARGTLANQLLQRDFIIQNDIKASAEHLTIKVHNDFDDVVSLVSMVRPKNVMLFHCQKSGCTALAEKLTEQGINVLTNAGQQYRIN